MCTRRLGEIVLIEYKDIIDGIVHVRGSTTKTFKSEGENFVERYPLAKEVRKILKTKTKTGTGQIFKHRVRSCMDKYRNMIENDCDLKMKKRGNEFPIRTHDNRHFIM
jgi:integrase